MDVYSGKNKRPIIIGGCYRSGTSLVRRILDSHSRIHCGPEIKFFLDFYNKYISDDLKHIRFFNTARHILDDETLFNILGQAFIQIHEKAAYEAGKARWSDKCPENIIYLDKWQALLGNSWLFIHVVRNPLDTLASIKKIDFSKTIPRNIDERIKLYKSYNIAGIEFGSRYPRRYYRLLYEDLVLNPEMTLRDLMKWLNEIFEKEQLKFNQYHHQDGIEDPKVTNTKMIHTKSVGIWPTILTKSESEKIWSETHTIWDQIDHDGSYTSMLKGESDIEGNFFVKSNVKAFLKRLFLRNIFL